MRAFERTCVRTCVCDKNDLFHFELSQSSEVGRIQREALLQRVEGSWFADMWPEGGLNLCTVEKY